MKKLGLNNIKWVVDPVALLNVEEWLKIKGKINLQKTAKKNIFIYSLSNSVKNSFISEVLSFFEKENNIIYTNSSEEFDKRTNTYPSIEEWIAYVNESDFIITDSFHCTLFCIMFNKKFVVLQRNNGENMKDRFLSLLKYLNLEERYIVQENVNVLEKELFNEIDWSKINAKMEKWVKDSRTTLLDALNF